MAIISETDMMTEFSTTHATAVTLSDSFASDRLTQSENMGSYLSLAIFFIVLQSLWASQQDYTGYALLQIDTDVDTVQQIWEKLPGNKKNELDIWNVVPGSHVDALVPPHSLAAFTASLETNNVSYSVLQDDIQQQISQQRSPGTDDLRSAKRGARSNVRTTRGAKRIFYKRSIVGQYVRVQQIYTWLDAAKTLFDQYIDIINIGSSTEGRPLKVVKLSWPNQAAGVKPAVFIEASTHAREWLSAATAVYLIDHILQTRQTSTTETLLRHYDIYIAPMANPDGYEYTHTTDRFWRKTRSQQSNGCYGVDTNRNWDYHWLDCCQFTGKPCIIGSDSGCASQNPCSDIYSGPSALSEPETQALADFIMARKDQIKFYLTMHSYGQEWYYPWDYTNLQVDDAAELRRLLQVGKDAQYAVHNKNYVIATGGQSSRYYIVAGSSADWARGVAGVNASFTVELRDTGRRGFTVPKSQIVPTGEETWAALQAMWLDKKDEWQ